MDTKKAAGHKDDIREGHHGDAIKLVCDQCLQMCDEPKKCSNCQTAFYCSVSCQKAHWPGHKLTCQKKKEQIEKFETSDFNLTIFFLQDVLQGGDITLSTGNKRMTNKDAAVYGINILCDQAILSPSIRKQLSKSRGRDDMTVCEALMAVMRMHSDSSEVKHYSSDVLSFPLTHHSDTSSHTSLF